MRLIRRNVVSPPPAHAKSPTAPSVYLFYEKTTGTAHFQVEAGPDGELPVDHAAGLLAVHCMVRGQCPNDYLIMVPAAPENLCDLSEKAQKLLEAGLSVKTGVKLTRREEEVLDGIFRSLANKEIACELNISERTVKFHISSLLSKFKVRGRMELMREASQQAMKPLPAVVGSPATMIRGFAPESEVSRRAANSGEILCLERPRMMAWSARISSIEKARLVSRSPMMSIIMCDLKSFGDVATLSQGQKHEVARLVEALCQRYHAAQELLSPDPGDGDVGTQLRCDRASHAVRNAFIRK